MGDIKGILGVKTMAHVGPLSIRDFPWDWQMPGHLQALAITCGRTPIKTAE